MSDQELLVQKVSDYSFWHEDVWRFYIASTGRTKIINWRYKFEDCWGDPRVVALINLGKRLVDYWRDGSIKDNSIIDRGSVLKGILVWMWENNVSDFSQFSLEVAEEYVGDLESLLNLDDALEEDFIADDAEPDVPPFDDDADDAQPDETRPSNDIDVSANTSLRIKRPAIYVYKRLFTIQKIFECSERFKAISGMSIPENPWNGQKLWHVAKDLVADVFFRVPAVPTKLYNAIASTTQVWIDTYSTDIIELQKRFIEARDLRNGSNSYTYLVDRALRGFRFNGRGTLAEDWRPPLDGALKVRRWESDHYVEVMRSPARQVRALVVDLTVAGMTSIQSATGMRSSETLSLLALPLHSNGLPACLRVRPSFNGLNEIFFIVGKTYKSVGNRLTEAEVEWVAGSRPVGTDWLPYPVQAVLMLLELHAPWREVHSCDELVVRIGGGGLPMTRVKTPRASSDFLLKAQNDFMRNHVQIPDEFHDWRLTTIQWRKRFAQDILTFDPMLLKSVSEHFKHASEIITEEAYGGDAILRRVIDSVASRAAAELFYEAIYGEAVIAGKSSERIYEYEGGLREVLASIDTLEGKKRKIMEILAEDNVRLFDSDYGGCLFRPGTARCHFECHGRFDFLAQRPLSTYRRPQLCGVCANLVVSQRHIPFWIARYLHHREIFDANVGVEGVPARIIAKDRMQLAESILARFNIEAEKLAA